MQCVTHAKPSAKALLEANVKRLLGYQRAAVLGGMGSACWMRGVQDLCEEGEELCSKFGSR